MVDEPFVNEDIRIQPWLPLEVDGAQYLIKSCFSTCETNYEIIVYDGLSMNMWQEIVNLERFGEKWKEYNPNIESSSSNLLMHVKNSFEECRQSSNIKITVESDEIINLAVKTKLKGTISFTWSFVCSKCQQEMVKNMLVDPLFAIVKELAREQQQLFSIIEKKDREIEDYKDQGYSTSRNHLTTRPFQKSRFLSGCMTDQKFHSNCTSPSIETLTDPDMTKLYRNVMINKTGEKKDIASTSMLPTSSLPPFDTLPTNPIDKILNAPPLSGAVPNPESVVDENIDEMVRGAVTINETATSTKNDEKVRREAIRKRLEEDERKNKKKKRKINI